MKSFAKDILECCTSLLETCGLTRKRRGLAFWRASDEIACAIALQHRDFPDNTVWIETYPQVFWEPVERLYSAGFGMHYRPFQNATRTRLYSFGISTDCPFAFHPTEDRQEPLERLLTHLVDDAIPKAASMAEADRIENFHLDFRDGLGHPEKYLCVKAWRKRSLQLDEEFHLAMGQLSSNEEKSRLGDFYRVLRASEHAAGLLTRPWTPTKR